MIREVTQFSIVEYRNPTGFYSPEKIDAMRLFDKSQDKIEGAGGIDNIRTVRLMEDGTLPGPGTMPFRYLEFALKERPADIFTRRKAAEERHAKEAARQARLEAVLDTARSLHVMKSNMDINRARRVAATMLERSGSAGPSSNDIKRHFPRLFRATAMAARPAGGRS